MRIGQESPALQKRCGSAVIRSYPRQSEDSHPELPAALAGDNFSFHVPHSQKLQTQGQTSQTSMPTHRHEMCENGKNAHFRQQTPHEMCENGKNAHSVVRLTVKNQKESR